MCLEVFNLGLFLDLFLVRVFYVNLEYRLVGSYIFLVGRFFFLVSIIVEIDVGVGFICSCYVGF